MALNVAVFPTCTFTRSLSLLEPLAETCTLVLSRTQGAGGIRARGIRICSDHLVGCRVDDRYVGTTHHGSCRVIRDAADAAGSDCRLCTGWREGYREQNIDQLLAFGDRLESTGMANATISMIRWRERFLSL